MIFDALLRLIALSVGFLVVLFLAWVLLHEEDDDEGK